MIRVGGTLGGWSTHDGWSVYNPVVLSACESVGNLVLFTLTGYWKPHIGYCWFNWQCGMLCQLIDSKLVSTACSLADLCRLVSEGGDSGP